MQSTRNKEATTKSTTKTAVPQAQRQAPTPPLRLAPSERGDGAMRRQRRAMPRGASTQKSQRKQENDEGKKQVREAKQIQSVFFVARHWLERSFSSVPLCNLWDKVGRLWQDSREHWERTIICPTLKHGAQKQAKEHEAILLLLRQNIR